MTGKWILFSHIEGRASRQAHADLPPDTFERELGKEGFYGPSTQMIHRHPPTRWSRFEGPLLPRAFDTNRIAPRPADSPWDATLLMRNPHLEVRHWRAQRSMNHLVRNGDGDELLFIHEGAAELFCDYGHLTLREGDYLILPRGTLWRLQLMAPLTALVIEASNDNFRLPDKGIVGEQAVFDAATLDMPRIDEAFRAQQTETEWRVVVKRRNALSTITYPFNPLDALGWHGTLAPVRLGKNTFLGNLPGRFEASAGTLFLRGFLMWLVTIGPLLASIVAMVASSAALTLSGASPPPARCHGGCRRARR
jgi:homogentisate 1,2-dioxygenase